MEAILSGFGKQLLMKGFVAIVGKEWLFCDFEGWLLLFRRILILWSVTYDT